MTAINVATLAELKSALATAAANGQADTITLTANISAVSGADFVAGTDGNDLLKIAITDGQTLSIVGGGFTLDANYFGRVLEVFSGTVAISNLTIREGGLAGKGGDYGQAGGSSLGAGIYNSANLTLSNVTVTANAASGGGGGGGTGYHTGGGGGGGGRGSLAGAGGVGYAGYTGERFDGGLPSGGTGGTGGAEPGYQTGGSGGFNLNEGLGGSYGGYIGGSGGLAIGGSSIGGISISGGGGGAGSGGSPLATGGNAVAGIFNSGVLLLSGSTVTGNAAAGGGGGSGVGSDDYGPTGGAAVGGIKNAGVLTLDGSSISDNVAAGGNGGRYHRGVGATGRVDANLGGDLPNHAHTGTVSFSGIATQGQTLTAANTLADTEGLGTISYQWTSDGANISGATNATLVLSQAQVGHLIAVTGRYTDGQGFAESATSSATSAVANINDAPTGSVTITGTATQGQLLTAHNTLADADGLGTIGYQWKSDGSPISGATGTTFTLTQAQVGHVVTVAASYADGASTAESVSSGGTASVANINDAPTGSVTITGTALQGEVLAAGNTLADADGLGTLSYQWKSDGSAISGATNATFTLTPTQVGHVVSVTASYTDGGNTSESVSSAATSAIVAPGAATNTNVATLAELKSALTTAATNGAADTITLTANISATSSADFVTGTGGNDLLKIALTDGQTLSIVGGGFTLDANSFGRALEVVNGTVEISNLTIREGGLAGNGGDHAQTGGEALGAGIRNAGDLTLTNVTVTANAASGGGGGGADGYVGAGGGLGTVAGDGGTGSSSQGSSPGAPASGGIGGTGGHPSNSSTIGGGGGSSTGGGGGYYDAGNRGGGNGGTAAINGVSIGGGGGGGGYTDLPGAGGTAVGGIFNSGILKLLGGTVSGNLAAGGGGGGAYFARGATPGGAGGSAVGGILNTGTLRLDNASVTLNAAGAGAPGINDSDLPGAAGTTDTNIRGASIVNHAATGVVSIAGAATEGQTLTASNTLADTDGLGTIGYQWRSDGIDISGATAATFVLTQAQVGHVVTVRASYTDGLGFTERATSSGTASVSVPTVTPPADPTPPSPPPATTGTVDGAVVSTTTTTNFDGSQSQTIVVAPVTAGRTDSGGGASTADIPVVTVNGINLVTVGLPAGTGISASGPTAPQTTGAAAPAFIAAISAGGSLNDQGQIANGANAFLQAHAGAPVLAQTLTLSGTPTSSPIVINGGSGVTTALVIDTHHLPGATVLTLDNVDFAAVIGAARITGGAGSQTVFADGAAQYIVLGADDDALHGGAGDDTIGSAGGADSLFGDDGQDYVFGGIGGDAVNGGSGNDVVQGNSGDDFVQGNAGDDLVYGGQGNDVVRGGQGDDQAWGDLDDDQVFGDLGNDTLNGGDGADIVQGNQGNDLVQGGAGADLV